MLTLELRQQLVQLQHRQVLRGEGKHCRGEYLRAKACGTSRPLQATWTQLLPQQRTQLSLRALASSSQRLQSIRQRKGFPLSVELHTKQPLGTIRKM